MEHCYPTLAALASAGDTADNLDCGYLTEAGREGEFVYLTADLSSEVAADTEKGIFVAKDSVQDGASGAWVRKYDRLKIEMFGGKADSSLSVSGTDNQPKIQAALDLLHFLGGGELWFEDESNIYGVNSPFLMRSHIHICGHGHIRNMLTTQAASGSTCCFLMGNYSGADTHSIFAEPSSAFIDIEDMPVGNSNVTLSNAGDASKISVGDVVILMSEGTWLTGSGTNRKRADYLNTREVVGISGNELTLHRPTTMPFDGTAKLLVPSGTVTDPVGNKAGFVKRSSIKGLTFSHRPNNSNRGIMAFGAAFQCELDIRTGPDTASMLISNLFVESHFKCRGTVTRKVIDAAYGCEDYSVDIVADKVTNDPIAAVLVGERSMGGYGRIAVNNPFQTTGQTMSLSDGINHCFEIDLNSPNCNGIVIGGTPYHYPSGNRITGQIRCRANYHVHVADEGGQIAEMNDIEVRTLETPIVAPAFASNTVRDVPVKVRVIGNNVPVQKRKHVTSNLQLRSIDGPQPIGRVEKYAELDDDSDTLILFHETLFPTHALEVGQSVKVRQKFEYTTPATGNRYFRIYQGSTNLGQIDLPASQTGQLFYLDAEMILTSSNEQLWLISYDDSVNGVQKMRVVTVEDFAPVANRFIRLRHRFASGGSARGKISIVHITD
ncbi:hypothetical protein [Sphingorhabdus sp. Alg239-R122]|uniref:hypothetical protein n=1 Tax=Sphingorhabdus sp. Alg239-R122 TaxID=2305989 RepID=UPI0019678ACC|nr:hypothetical protein [Sphingorhabdus sp. Alg239-R122]